MSSASAGRLYDALHDLEARFRGGGAYPIHKALRFDFGREIDLYDWIADEIEMPDGGHVLDAGCGVGFGSLRLAERSRSHVTGISVSGREIERARQCARRSGLCERLTFEQRSFDDLPPRVFDSVVAVESLKHSADLAASLRSLLRSIKPGGQLVIVEDLVSGNADPESRIRLAGDWHLSRLYAETDYRAGLEEVNYHVLDLSEAVARRGKLAINAKLWAVGVVLNFTSGALAEALRAFRGGLYLERLYGRGAMTYKAFLCRVGGT